MIYLLEPFVIAIEQLMANKLRSILSLMGILIAVGAVTGVVSLGDGLQKAIYQEFEQIGGFTTIWSWAPDPWYREKSGRWVKRDWEEHMTFKDIEAIKAETDRVEFVVPNTSMGSQLRRGSTAMSASVEFTSPEMIHTENYKIAEGRFLTSLDLITNAKVVVLASQIAEDLFGPDVSPVDKEIKIQDSRYTVVGVLEPKQFFDNNYNSRTMIPATTGSRRFLGNDHIGYIIVKVKTPEDVDAVVAAMRRVYKRIHEHGDEMEIQTGKAALEEINQVLLIMKAVAGGVAGISLLVGGIGIMNIMLVSVTERTREIGIRKALGARRFTILWQFMVEAVVLCLFGGLLGIGLGLIIGKVISAFIMSKTSMPFLSVISPSMAVLATGFSLFVGCTFGVYPAWKASRLEPVEALRQE